MQMSDHQFSLYQTVGWCSTACRLLNPQPSPTSTPPPPTSPTPPPISPSPSPPNAASVCLAHLQLLNIFPHFTSIPCFLSLLPLHLHISRFHSLLPSASIFSASFLSSLSLYTPVSSASFLSSLFTILSPAFSFFSLYTFISGSLFLLPSHPCFFIIPIFYLLSLTLLRQYLLLSSLPILSVSFLPRLLIYIYIFVFLPILSLHLSLSLSLSSFSCLLSFHRSRLHVFLLSWICTFLPFPLLLTYCFLSLLSLSLCQLLYYFLFLNYIIFRSLSS